MPSRTLKPFQQVVAELGQYPEDAFHFVRNGLSYAVEKIHGSSTPAQLALFQLLEENNIEVSELLEGHAAGQLSPQLAGALEAAGGVEKFNRHVSGQDLSWGLRDYAIQQWGLLARTVLARWGITRTIDLGRIVFAMVDNGYMQKQPRDSVEDFRDVFDFHEAFDQAFRPGVPGIEA